MRKARVLGYLAGAIVVLLAAVLLAVRVWVDPNHYKGNLAAVVKESTGRELQLPGDIKLSVVPWVALEVGPASLSNLPGFGDEPLVGILSRYLSRQTSAAAAPAAGSFPH